MFTANLNESENSIHQKSGDVKFFFDEMTSHLSKYVKFSNIRFHEEIDSTNEQAKSLALSGAEPGTVVIANAQTAGKGRFGKKFFSPGGSGIYVSFILDRAGELDLVTVRAAVIVAEIIEELCGESPGIKWVNDLFLRGKKVCGILAETVSASSETPVKWIVLGVGVNFTAPQNGFLGEIKSSAGAVFENDPPPLSRERFAAEIINRFAKFYDRADGEIVREYRKRMMNPDEMCEQFVNNYLRA